MSARSPFALGLLLLAGCEEVWLPMEPSRLCDDVRYAIAARTFDCEGDETLATARSEAFTEGYRCAVESLDEPIDRYYHCPVAIGHLSCAEARDAGDDLDVWLAASSACAEFVTRADGSPIAPETGQ